MNFKFLILSFLVLFSFFPLIFAASETIVSETLLQSSSGDAIYVNGSINVTSVSTTTTIDIHNLTGGGTFTNLNSTNLSLIRFFDIQFPNDVIYSNGTILINQSTAEILIPAGESIEVYNNETSPGGGPGGAGGSAGGGTSSVEEVFDFKLNPNLLKVVSFQGEVLTQEFELTNNGTEDLTFQISSSDSLSEFVLIIDNNFLVKSGESKNVSIAFYSSENSPPDIHTGRIFFEASGLIKFSSVIFEIKERNPIFDVFVNASQNAFRGGKINSEIKIINMGNLKDIDLLLYYSIKDFEGRDLVFKEESLFINEFLDLERSLEVPEDFEGENGVFYVKVSYNNITATASDSFQVLNLEKDYSLFYLAGAFLFLIFAIIFAVLKLKNKKTKKEKIKSKRNKRKKVGKYKINHLRNLKKNRKKKRQKKKKAGKKKRK